MKLTVICWLWQGRRAGLYNFHHVNGLYRQFQGRLRFPHRFVCITDEPKGIECETYPLWNFPKVRETIRRGFDCWKRLKLFDPELNKQFGDRIISTDLGVIIREIEPLIDWNLDFQAMGGGYSLVNGGFWTLKTGTHARVWETFDPETSALAVEQSKRDGKFIVGSDQGWMSIQMPESHVWGPQDGVYHMRTLFGQESIPDNLRYLSFPGSVKPWFGKVRRVFPELHAEYMSFMDREYSQEVDKALANGQQRP